LLKKFNKRQTPMVGKDYHWLTGEFINQTKVNTPTSGALFKAYFRGSGSA
jgi:hypothetical protein